VGAIASHSFLPVQAARGRPSRVGSARRSAYTLGSQMFVSKMSVILAAEPCSLVGVCRRFTSVLFTWSGRSSPRQQAL
jgi:hypothetical protein